MSELKPPVSKWIVIFASVVGAAAGSFTVQHMLSSHSPPDFDKSLTQIAEVISKTLPKTVDSETRLDSVAALPGKNFVYKYTLVNHVKSDIDPSEFVGASRPQAENSYQTSPDFKLFRDKGVTLKYSYYDKEGVFIADFSVAADGAAPSSP